MLNEPLLFLFATDVAFASLYLKTLPHTSVDATVWVWSWIASERTRSTEAVAASLLTHRVSCFAFSREPVEWLVGLDHLDAYPVTSVVVPIQGESSQYTRPN
jgi:hypothetical protein